MSGWNLPPGCTDADIDRACPGYYDEPETDTDEEPQMSDQRWKQVTPSTDVMIVPGGLVMRTNDGQNATVALCYIPCGLQSIRHFIAEDPAYLWSELEREYDFDDEPNT